MKNDGTRDDQTGPRRIQTLVRRVRAGSRSMRAPAQLVGVVAVTLLAASILIAPVNALWSTNLVLQGSVSLSGLLEGTTTPEATASTTPTPSTTVEPSTTAEVSTTPTTPTTTPTACAAASFVDLVFDGNVALSGESPFDAVLSVTNNGDAIASGVMIGFAPTEGWGYIKRVDFDLPDGQFWLVDGQPDGTLYELDDLAPGDTAQIFLSIQMIEAWRDAPIEARVVFTAAFADLACPGGDTASATITITRGDLAETETPEPSETAEPDTTPTFGTTKTSVPNQTEIAVTGTPDTTTATPESTATEPVPTTAVPSETPTPTNTATTTPEESETSIPITETTLPKTAEPSETFEPETETPAPDPSKTATPANKATAGPARTHTSVPTATISATPSIPPTSTVLASAATPPPTVVNTVLGQEARPRSGQVLPDTGDGARFGGRSAGVGLIVIVAAALGFLGVAIGLGRRRA